MIWHWVLDRPRWMRRAVYYLARPIYWLGGAVQGAVEADTDWRRERTPFTGWRMTEAEWRER